MPPIYGRKTFGIFIEPSAHTLFSNRAINPLGEATTVLFRVWARTVPLSVLNFMLRRLAWASPRLEQDATSKYFFWRGLHASMSQDLTFRSAKSPEQHSSWRTGISKFLKMSTVNLRMDGKNGVMIIM